MNSALLLCATHLLFDRRQTIPGWCPGHDFTQNGGSVVRAWRRRSSRGCSDGSLAWSTATWKKTKRLASPRWVVVDVECDLHARLFVWCSPGQRNDTHARIFVGGHTPQVLLNIGMGIICVWSLRQMYYLGDCHTVSDMAMNEWRISTLSSCPQAIDALPPCMVFRLFIRKYPNPEGRLPLILWQYFGSRSLNCFPDCCEENPYSQIRSQYQDDWSLMPGHSSICELS